MSMMSRVRVHAPATLSNLGPGFDVLGLAVEQPGDYVEAEWSDTPGVEIVEVRGDSGGLTTDPTRNVVGIAATAALLAFDARRGVSRPPGVRLWLDKRMPLASGLGSSAASSVGGALAVSELLGGVFGRDDLITCALEGERAVSGGVHADNVAPCVAGGIILIRRYAPMELLSLPVPEALRVAVVHPHTTVVTAEARRMVAERRFQIGEVVDNLGQLGALVTALHRGDLELFGRSISDALVEPIRAPLVPGFAEVKQTALEAGALGCSLSGSGPSVFAFAASDDQAAELASRMAARFHEVAGLDSDTYVGKVNMGGARRVERDE
jgi:homoserine kinase